MVGMPPVWAQGRFRVLGSTDTTSLSCLQYGHQHQPTHWGSETSLDAASCRFCFPAFPFGGACLFGPIGQFCSPR